MIPIFLYWFLFLQLILVSVIDIKYRKISNTWFFINLSFFVSFLFIFPDIYSFNYSALKYSFGFIVVGLILFKYKIMGAGDSKFLASFYLLVPQVLQYPLFIQILYTTIAISAILFLVNVLKNFVRIKNAIFLLQPAGIKDLIGRKFTYAPIILLAWLGIGWFYVF